MDIDRVSCISVGNIELFIISILFFTMRTSSYSVQPCSRMYIQTILLIDEDV
jgi:hypothetical protein